MAGDSNPPGMLLAAMKSAFGTLGWSFSFSEVPIDARDIVQVFPRGAPAAIYAPEVASQARGLRTVFGAPTLRVKELIERVEPDQVGETTRNAIAKHLVDLARAEGRALNAREQLFAGRSTGPTGPPPSGQTAVGRQTASAATEETFGGAIARWRAAEVAAMEYLNARGWNLQDVSRQNVGYDLSGTNSDGADVHVEVKKVEGKDSRFALTNNEMAVMVGASSRYMLALVIGDGRTAQLALLDPLRDQVPRERVCRRWEWEYTDWSRFAEIVS